MRHTAESSLVLDRAVVPDAHGAGVVDGDDIDTQGFDELALLIDVGNVGTGGDISVQIQEADDDGAGAPDSYASISGAVIAQTAVGQTRARIRLFGRKRWIRAQVTVADDTVDFGIAYVGLQLKDSATATGTTWDLVI